MPIREYAVEYDDEEVDAGDSDFLAFTSKGVVDTAEESGVRYIVRFDSREDRVPFLVLHDEAEKSVSAIFHWHPGGWIIAGPDEFDWGSSGIKVMTREEALNTGLGPATFRVLDEIWLHDPELGGVLGSNTVAFDSRPAISDAALTEEALNSPGPKENEPRSGSFLSWVERLKSKVRRLR